jgi:hypothetical protein
MIRPIAKETQLANAASPPERINTAGGLTLFTAITADGGVFARFFKGYDKAFVLPNEKEDEAGFARCFALNFGAAYERLSQLYGAYSEVCLVAHDGDVEIGGANFIAMPVDAHTVSANLNYIYINQNARGRGALSRLVAGVSDTMGALYPGRLRRLMFIEQNDPFRMSAEDYQRDTEFTGLDQFDRLRIWARRGARVVDMAYAQPPLSAEQGADDTLVYSVMGAGADHLDACVLEAHLTRFFGVSVLKGADIGDNPVASSQIARLRSDCAAGKQIALLDPRAQLEKLARREDIARLWRENPPLDFRSALRA